MSEVTSLFRKHQFWIGNVRPVGLLVSARVLEAAQVAVELNPVALHGQFLELLPRDKRGGIIPELPSFGEFAERVLEWDADRIVAPPESAKAFLEAYREELSPTAVLVDQNDKPLILIDEVGAGVPFDDPPKAHLHSWNASPHARIERLLRETGNPIGILAGPATVRLIYAPKGESTAHATFYVDQMATVQGRILLGALQMLLGRERLMVGPLQERLPAILARSREYQNEVSTELSGQVLEALFELLRGLQSADDYSKRALLRDTLRSNASLVYNGLVTVLMRLVFLLYAEDRGLMPQDPIYAEHYGVSRLFDQLQRDENEFPAEMSRRYGAWARLLALFRLVYNGGRHGRLQVPARHGYLFDPDRYPFLSALDEHGHVPHVPDGTVLGVLRKLLILDKERLSYRALDVEQIGSVYEAIMGFELHVADGPSRAIRSGKKNGPPVTINLETLLKRASDGRAKWLKAETGADLAGEASKLLKAAKTFEDLEAALQKRIHHGVTPERVRAGAMILQPSLERRRSGSHYTPRSLTKPIVEETLAPVFADLGDNPTPEQILQLKVCDPAMGSGAFLVEATRQIAGRLTEAWQRHGNRPEIPEDEDEILLAQRVVVQRCIYGVDKNVMAVDLAKLSLWLATLARDHAFTFLDHTLRNGDSLVGLDVRQIASLSWQSGQQLLFLDTELTKRLAAATKARIEILEAQGVEYDILLQKLALADEQLQLVRMIADAICAAYLLNEKPKAKEAAIDHLGALVNAYLNGNDLEAGIAIDDRSRPLRLAAVKPVPAFHWEIDFPEVFRPETSTGATSGFDAIVGNPPFAGKNTLAEGTIKTYPKWLQQVHPSSHGNSDLVAHFFRRAFELLKPDGCFGLLATNTIGQGDTRYTGLRWIRTRGGTIYRATKRVRWPGEAASVVVSIVHVRRGPYEGTALLNGRPVALITAYLFHGGPDENPDLLAANQDLSFQGSIVLGMGFTFDDKDKKQVAWPLSKRDELVAHDPRNGERIFPYLGGKEINDDPEQAHRRYVINFGNLPLRRHELSPSWKDADDDTRREYIKAGIVPLDYSEPVAADWREMLDMIEERVKPERMKKADEYGRTYWWRFLRTRPEMQAAIANLSRILLCSRHSPFLSIASVATPLVPSDATVVFASDSYNMFAVLQSSVHEIWTRMMTSSMKDDLRYAPSDCFETFPFPRNYENNEALEHAGRLYYEYRAGLMRDTRKGLTKTYNRFHDQYDRASDIKRLRELHDAMDRTVLDAYCWADLQPVADFEPEFGADLSEDSDGAEGLPIPVKRKGGNKKPKGKLRRRWPEEDRDEVLLRLLKLNGVYSAEAPIFKKADHDDEEEFIDEDSEDAEDEESDDE